MLITGLHEAGEVVVIDSLLSLVSTTPQINAQINFKNKKLVWYGNYVKERHLQAHLSVTTNTWLPSPTQKFINLAIIKKERIQRGKIDDDFVQKSIRGQIDDILLEKSPIKLEEIFSKIEGERKVILIDGAPGSGKTSLTVHICQGWSRGELFQEFTVVILVQLRDPAVQNAECITDLLPSRNREMAEEVARAITAEDGRGILWVFDGFDELPSNLRERSYLRDIIIPPAESPISLSSVIVTSRPISSGDLCESVSSRIEVLGFTTEEQRQYFAECLNGDTQAVDNLAEILSENPGIEGSCYLPLNASIVAHLYLCDGSIPNTVYGMFSSFIQHFLSRYLCERLGKTREEARLRSLSNLPSELRGPFSKLCELAFKGTSKNNVTFTESDLEAVKHSAVIRKMGLLQATPSIISNGKVVYYKFPHLSVQEVLTAVYISRLPANLQISTFDTLFGDSRFGPVLQYYAAITKLRTSRPWLSKLPSRWIPERITVHMLDLVRRIIAKKSKPLLVSLFHCLYEAQDPFLCQFVVKQLGGILDLSNTSLTPVDCLAIGYLLSSVTLTASNNKVFNVNLSSCSLGDAGIKNLMCSISRHIDPHSTLSTLLDIELKSSEIHEQGASHIAEVLNNNSIVSGLWLGHNQIGDKGLQNIFDSLKQNNTLKVLDVTYCDMVDAGVSSLAWVMNLNTKLEILVISGNQIGDKGLRTIFSSLKQNNTLKVLDVTHCGMTDAGVPSLAEAMKINKTLKRLNFLNQCTILKQYNIFLVSVLHCLYETQDPSLCQFVAEQLGGSFKLHLSDTSLTPVDCLAIGYFLSSVTLTANNNKVFTVDLNSCSLGDAGTKNLMSGISRHIIVPHNTHLGIVLRSNEIHEEGASHIAEVLHNTSIVSALWLGVNPIGDKGLQTIFNGLKQNNTLKRLDVSRCGITDVGVVSSLAETMNILNAKIENLEISGNPIGDKGLQAIFNCLKQNNSLKVLDISHCGMTDAGVSSLAEAMNINTALERLYMYGNDAITDNGLICLVKVLSRNSRLVRLRLPRHLKVNEVSKTINEARERRGLEVMELM